MKLFLAAIIITLGLTSATRFEKKSESRTVKYIAQKMGIYNKYAILEVTDSIAELEIYAKYDGDIVPVNMSWNSKIDPEKYLLSGDFIDSLAVAFHGSIVDIVVHENDAEVKLKYSFMGGFDLHFERVDELPKKYEQVRNRAYMFTGRNAVGYKYKTENGYQSYDKFMKGNILYKECDQLNFHEFAQKYDSVQKNIFIKMTHIHDSLLIHSALEREQVVQE